MLLARPLEECDACTSFFPPPPLFSWHFRKRRSDWKGMPSPYRPSHNHPPNYHQHHRRLHHHSSETGNKWSKYENENVGVHFRRGTWNSLWLFYSLKFFFEKIALTSDFNFPTSNFGSGLAPSSSSSGPPDSNFLKKSLCCLLPLRINSSSASFSTMDLHVEYQKCSKSSKNVIDMVANIK